MSPTRCVADGGGNVSVFALGREKRPPAGVEADACIRASPAFANGVLYLMTDRTLYAIAAKP